MRWVIGEKKKIEIGDTRVIRKFLLLPRKLYNPKIRKYECRWLEYSNIYQTYDLGIFFDGWHNISWTDIIISK